MSSFSLPWGCAWKICISKRSNATILCWIIVSFRALILLSRRASLSVLYGNHPPPSPPPTRAGQELTSQYVRRFAHFKIYFSVKFTLFKNDHTIQKGRWCPRRSPIGPYLLFRFLQRNEHSKLSSTENSSWKISCATPLLEILLCSHLMEKSENLTLWDPGLTQVMDS